MSEAKKPGRKKKSEPVTFDQLLEQAALGTSESWEFVLKKTSTLTQVHTVHWALAEGLHNESIYLKRLAALLIYKWSQNSFNNENGEWFTRCSELTQEEIEKILTNIIEDESEDLYLRLLITAGKQYREKQVSKDLIDTLTKAAQAAGDPLLISLLS